MDAYSSNVCIHMHRQRVNAGMDKYLNQLNQLLTHLVATQQSGINEQSHKDYQTLINQREEIQKSKSGSSAGGGKKGGGGVLQPEINDQFNIKKYSKNAKDLMSEEL